MRTTIRLRGPAEMITALPYHLGYRPTDSLVLVCLNGGQLGAVGRIDLPPPEVDPQLLVDELMPLVREQQPDSAILIGYESQLRQSEAGSVALRDALTDAGVEIVARLVVHGDRWWSLDCSGECCPAEGEPLPGEEQVPAIADYIVLGRHPAQNRQELRDRLRGPVGPEQDARCAVLMRDLASARQHPRRLQRRQRRMFEHWARILGTIKEAAALDDEASSSGADPVPPPGDEAWAWAVVSLLDTSVRDLLIAWLCPGALELEVFPVALRRLATTELPRPLRHSGNSTSRSSQGISSQGISSQGIGSRDGVRAPAAWQEDITAEEQLVERLAMVCRQAPPELSPGPLTLFAHVVWWRGDGALARTALDMALEVDPRYKLAEILGRMVDAAFRPGFSA